MAGAPIDFHLADSPALLVGSAAPPKPRSAYKIEQQIEPNGSDPVNGTPRPNHKPKPKVAFDLAIQCDQPEPPSPRGVILTSVSAQ